MAAVAGIIGSVLGSEAASGDESKVGEANVAQNNTNIANTQNQKPDIKTTEVKNAVDTTPNGSATSDTHSIGEIKDNKGTTATNSSPNWADIAKMAQGLLSSGNQQQTVSVNSVSQPQQIANF